MKGQRRKITPNSTRGGGGGESELCLKSNVANVKITFVKQFLFFFVFFSKETLTENLTFKSLM